MVFFLLRAIVLHYTAKIPRSVRYLLGFSFFLYAEPVFSLGFNTTIGLIGAVVGGTALGVAAVVGFVPAAATLAIGTVVAAITFSPTQSAVDSPLVVQISPSTKLQTPAGYTPAPSGQIQPVPPANATPISGWGSAANSILVQPDVSSFQAAVTAKWGYSGVSCSLVDDHLNPSYVHCSNSNWSFNSDYLSTSCPPGYSGSSCGLSNPSVVMKPADQVCGVLRSGNSFGTDPQDPDCSTIAATTGLTIAPQSVSATAPDGSTTTVIINPDGSTTVYKTIPHTGDATPTTTTETTSISAPDSNGDAKVSGQGSVTTDGAGVGASGSAVSKVTFDKTGLATTSGQDTGNATLSDIKNALTDTSHQPAPGGLEGGAAGDVPSGASFTPNQGQVTGLLSGLLSKIGIPAGGQCGLSLPLSLFGQSFVVDLSPYCLAWSPYVNWAFWILTVLFVFRETAIHKAA